MTDLPAAAVTAIVDAIARLPQVAAGWAFGVPPEAREEWLRPVAIAALEAAAPHITAADPTTETEGFRAYTAGLAAGRAEGTSAERERIRAAITDEYGPSEARKMRRVLLGDSR